MNATIFRFFPAFGRSLVIQDYETALLFRHGRYLRPLAPGKYRFWSAGYEIKRIDTREQMLLVQGQEMLSADQVVLKVTALATFRVTDALTLHRATGDASAVLYSEIQLALRQVVSADTAEGFLQQKTGHGATLSALLAERARTLGITVERVELRDVMLPAELKRSFMSALQQRHEAQASLEKARSETAALRTLANAAKLVRDNPELLQLRYLQTLEEVGTGIGNTLVLGLTDSETLRATKG